MKTNLDDILQDFTKPVTNPDQDVIELLEKAQINTNVQLKKLPVLLSILDGYNEIDLFTEGNISVIKGRAKSRKSFAVSMFLGAYLSTVPIYRKFSAKTQKICVLFDTEQSSFYVQQSMYRIRQIAEEKQYSTRFFGFCLRPFDPATRLKMIEYVIKNVCPLGLVVIDGIRDLVRDINSAEEATFISSKLLKWTEETGCHILTVIHENKADGNARGHIGAELINKAETVLRVEKQDIQKDVSKISADMVRGHDFEDIYFTVEENIPIIINHQYLIKDAKGL